jgi:hypothetical protein
MVPNGLMSANHFSAVCPVAEPDMIWSAEAFFGDDRVRARLQSARAGGGVPLLNERSILRVRMAKAQERARYRDRMAERSGELGVVFLVDIAPE